MDMDRRKREQGVEPVCKTIPADSCIKRLSPVLKTGFFS